jgi:N-acetylmuramoyl-L-alanine amidase
LRTSTRSAARNKERSSGGRAWCLRASRGWLLAAAAGLATGACGNAAGQPQSGATAPARQPASHAATAPAASEGGAGTVSPAPAAPGKLLAGKIVGIDPGHNGGNFSDPAFINRLIWNGREEETCDNTGTQTAGGYTEARFNFNVARHLRSDLEALGARVVMTRTNNHGVGPCVTRRARILDDAHANVAIDIHADGGPVSGRGFTVLEPVADGPNDHVIRASERFGNDIRAALLQHTSMPESDYYGSHGIQFRDNLAGLNLTTVPKVLIECGNMPNPTDAALLTSPRFQGRLAAAFTAAIVTFLTGHRA